MNYIDLLTQEEKPILCRIITGKDFKELFKRNEQEFSKIRKGFRAKSLTEQQENLQTLWCITLSAASWKSDLSFEQNTEYLRLKPPFSQGYWVNKPDTTGTVSILRIGMKGSQLYYLYRYYGTTMEVSPLPQWQVEFYNYRSLACACLSTYGTLPPIEYFEDGALVHVHMNYLLPPRELEFLKLYSWPEICTSLPCNFRRKLSIEVFTAIKNVLSDEGYEFKGGTI